MRVSSQFWNHCQKSNNKNQGTDGGGCGQVSLIDLLILVVSLGLTTFSYNRIQYGHNHYLGTPKLALLTLLTLLNGEMSVESGQVCLIGPCS